MKSGLLARRLRAAVIELLGLAALFTFLTLYPDGWPPRTERPGAAGANAPSAVATAAHDAPPLSGAERAAFVTDRLQTAAARLERGVGDHLSRLSAELLGP